MLQLSKYLLGWSSFTTCDGNDGPWSTFALRIGSQSTVVKVTIATSGQETWTVVPEGCTSSDPSDCSDLRGYLFYPNESSTWIDNKIRPLDDESNLGYTGNGEYGFDSVALGWSGGVNLSHQIVAGIATKDFYLGVFGVSPRPTNFSDFNDPQPSFLTGLWNESLIPSRSYGYTAGAYYRDAGIQGSLVLGGYDSSLFTQNDISFDMNPVTYRDLVVGIQSISYTSTNTSTSSSLYSYSASDTSDIYAFLDANTPHIWLPADVCSAFESAFNLTLDATTDLYLINSTQHTALSALNPGFTFTLASSVLNSTAINITLPYSSLALHATSAYPSLTNASRYLALRRAANSTQYTLGRAFLQEAYLVVDYERSNFSVSQRDFDTSASQTLVSIQPVDNGNGANGTSGGNSTTASETGSGEGLSGGAIGGIVVGAVVVLVAVSLLLFWLLRRRKERGGKGGEESGEADAKPQTELDSEMKHELGAGMPQELSSIDDPRHEVEDTSRPVEMLGDAVAGEGDTGLVAELEAKQEDGEGVEAAELPGRNTEIAELPADAEWRDRR